MRLSALLDPLRYLFDPTETLFLPFLLSAALVAVLVDRRRGERSFLVVNPRLRRRALHDVVLYAIDKIVFRRVIGRLFVAGLPLGGLLFAELNSHVTTRPLVHGTTARVVFTLVTFGAADLSYYAAHYLQHKVPVLWCFHKAHHSAVSLTPFTLYRTHPADDIIEIVSFVAFTAAAQATTLFFVAPGTSTLMVGQANVLCLVVIAGIANMRHSATWITWGTRLRALERVVASPAQHQLHHSADVAHYDRNFGGGMAVWDWMFGTQIVPAQHHQQLVFGLGLESERYATLMECYMTPLRDARAHLLPPKPARQPRQIRPKAPVAHQPAPITRTLASEVSNAAV